VVDDAAEAPIRPLTSLQGLPYALFLQVDSAVCSPRALCERAGLYRLLTNYFWVAQILHQYPFEMGAYEHQND
jgi:hypothetical protein